MGWRGEVDREIDLHGPVELSLTLGPFRRGARDPTFARLPDGVWRATRTPDGPATVRFAGGGRTGRVQVSAWGPGARNALDRAPGMVGAADRPSSFDPPPGLVRDIHRRHPGLRIPRSAAVFEAILPTIIEQKVAGVEAFRSFRSLVLFWGEPAPGPGASLGLRVAPSPADLATRPYFEFHRFGIERKRATAIVMAASRAARLEEAASMDPEAARRRLCALPGVGPWTAAEVGLVALGDADAVPVGDYHLPHMVAWNLAGEPRGTDERMLELLAPFAGHRGRALRLLTLGGAGAPRFGPRMRLRSLRSI
ncbi:MAG TPA: DNA-3-methyladenine glycosylase 2 family protein [Actinomycetota bacterium]|nr:DNA-3-methyladenine glycosylase 2 family protein [Actinomycetota bacterium]